MIRKLLVVALFFMLTTALSAQVIHRIDGTTISGDELEQRVNDLMKAANVSGMGLSVFNKNKPVFSKTFGLANVPQKEPLRLTSVMYGASFAKLVFAYIVMQYVQEKVIDLDKPLVSYLSKPLPDYVFQSKRRGYQDLATDDRYKQLTGRMCLNHTTGLPNWRWYEADKKLKIKFDPGTRYSYSGEGIYLLMFVLEQVTGKNYEIIAQERAFKPLNMVSTSQVWQPSFDSTICFGHNAAGQAYELSKRTEANAAGSMSTTVADYTRFFTALMQHKGLTKEGFNELIRPQVRIRSKQQFGPDALVDVTDNDTIRLSYGLGVGVLATPYGRAFFKEGHDDGWGHYSICFPDKQIGIVIMTNNDNGERIFKELLATAIGDTFTPWQWENYVPYNSK